MDLGPDPSGGPAEPWQRAYGGPIEELRAARVVDQSTDRDGGRQRGTPPHSRTLAFGQMRRERAVLLRCHLVRIPLFRRLASPLTDAAGPVGRSNEGRLPPPLGEQVVRLGARGRPGPVSDEPRAVPEQRVVLGDLGTSLEVREPRLIPPPGKLLEERAGRL